MAIQNSIIWILRRTRFSLNRFWFTFYCRFPREGGGGGGRGRGGGEGRGAREGEGTEGRRRVVLGAVYLVRLNDWRSRMLRPCLVHGSAQSVVSRNAVVVLVSSTHKSGNKAQHIRRKLSIISHSSRALHIGKVLPVPCVCSRHLCACPFCGKA